MSNYLVVSQHTRHAEFVQQLQATLQGNWHLITRPSDFTYDKLLALKPKYIFLPHWSHIIPKQIVESFNCVVFHMTDLPFGRGGSPLQNLIVRKVKETKLTAFKCTKELDAGPIYAQLLMSLSGSAREIFQRADELVAQLIFQIIQNDMEPTPQVGEVVTFKRRTPAQSNLVSLEQLDDIYDYIRMLDADGYPHAYIETEYFNFTFTQASFHGDEVRAIVSIKEK
ncbi:formyltransferase family protein [Thalassotalea sp. G2M2-11]|uniref:formyltransferase family protein n=1 Tax=Thalassotalea sp. G2M2-11 TaxID=2787627 RepID=UPI0019D30AB3|nr:formyltransferase family protein [Thalassotalea sp. G2M2-11]